MKQGENSGRNGQQSMLSVAYLEPGVRGRILLNELLDHVFLLCVEERSQRVSYRGQFRDKFNVEVRRRFESLASRTLGVQEVFWGHTFGGEVLLKSVDARRGHVDGSSVREGMRILILKPKTTETRITVYCSLPFRMTGPISMRIANRSSQREKERGRMALTRTEDGIGRDKSVLFDRC